MRTIAKKKIVIYLLAAFVGGFFIWLLFGESGSVYIDGDGMGDTNARIERARDENERAGELNQRIEGSVGRLERQQQKIESGVGTVEDVADRAERILEQDRASLERIRAVVNSVEKRRIEKADKP